MSAMTRIDVSRHANVSVRGLDGESLARRRTRFWVEIGGAALGVALAALIYFALNAATRAAGADAQTIFLEN